MRLTVVFIFDFGWISWDTFDNSGSVQWEGTLKAAGVY